MDIASPFLCLCRWRGLRSGELGLAALAALIFLAVMGVAAWLILKRLNLSFRVYGPALAFPNNGNLGLPISTVMSVLSIPLLLAAFMSSSYSTKPISTAA